MKPYKRSLRKDLTGKKFGMLSVISLNGRDKGGRALWLCQCDCGDFVVVEGHNLQSGHSTSCGCTRFTEKYGKDIIGKRFGRLVALNQYRKDGYTMVDCKCDCGNDFTTYRMSLVADSTLSCGCYHRDRTIELFTRHGMTGTRIHDIWAGMRSRCNLVTNSTYKDYGGRGIKVSEKWEGEHGFENFYKWSTDNGYADDLQIDRIDNNGNYSPENCRWTDRITQTNNTRRNIFFEYKGERKTMAQWARFLNIDYNKAYRRIHQLKWSVDKAFEKP